MRFFLFFLFFLSLEQYVLAQDTLFTKSVEGVGNHNLSVSNAVYINNKIIFFVSNYRDSVANPTICMIVMDTCGNIEKRHLIAIEGSQGLEFSGLRESVVITKDSKILITALQDDYSLFGKPKMYILKVDMEGKVLKKNSFHTGGFRFYPVKVFEKDSMFYLSGFQFSVNTPGTYLSFLMKIDKEY
jgi:hypothetical protein